MKTLLSGTLLLSALMLSFPAAADSWYSSHSGWGSNRGYDRGYDRHRGWSGSRGYRGNRHGYDRSWYAPHRSRRDGNYFSFSFGSNHSYSRRQHNYRHYDRHYGRHHDVDAGAVLGGLVLGSLLTSSFRDYDRDYDRPRNVRTYTSVRSTPVIRTREVVYVNRDSAPRPTPSGRRLLRDLDGNCFEITRQADGDELRTQLDPSACNF
ncbi:MAG: hypothetical protein WD396_07860 [Pseudohongiellaceae bacterium]